MSTIKLRSIGISFKETFEFPVEDYLEYCYEYEITPSQEHYKKLIVQQFIETLQDDIDEDKFEFTYADLKEYDVEDLQESKSVPLDYGKYVEDLDDDEINQFHKWCETDQMNLNPVYTKEDILIMCSNENPSIDYGVKINKETGEILYIKKSIYSDFLYQWLKNETT
jgi:hypothetical protein